MRSRNVSSQLGAGFKSMAGGRAQGHDENAQRSCDEAQNRLVEAAEQRGADAVLAMRFDANIG